MSEAFTPTGPQRRLLFKLSLLDDVGIACACLAPQRPGGFSWQHTIEPLLQRGLVEQHEIEILVPGELEPTHDPYIRLTSAGAVVAAEIEADIAAGIPIE